MYYKNSFFIFVISLLVLFSLPSVFSIRFNECGYGEGRFGTGEDCPGTNTDSGGSSSSGGEVVTPSLEEIPELPVLPSELTPAQEIISVAVTEAAEGHVEMEIVSRTDEGEIETAEIGLDLESQEIAPGVFVDVPSLDLDLDIKDVNIPPAIDTDLGPNYGYLTILVLGLLNIVVVLGIVKDISPKINKYYKNRKGQLFIIAAVIFILALYSVVINYNTAKSYTGLEDFKYLSDNYKSEFPKVANLALYTGKLNPAEALTVFTGAFVQQARAKDPNFGVFYLFKDSTGDLHIVNMLNKKAIVLDFQNGVTGENVKIGLLSSNNDAAGDICIKGGECTEAKGKVADFDEAYYKQKIDIPLTELKVEEIGAFGGLSVDLTKHFTSLTYTTSEKEAILGTATNIGVELVEY